MEEIYIQNIIRNLKQLEVSKDKLEQEIKEYEARIKEYMLKYSIEEIHGLEGEKVIYREVLGKRFDTKEFKKQFESLYNAYLKNTRNLRFKFTY